MKNQPRRPNSYAQIGNLALIKTLNYGISSKVKLARDLTTGKEYAVKIIKPEFEARYLSTLDQEAKFLSMLNKDAHPHIIRLIDCYSKADYIKKNGKVRKVCALVLELAEGGDLFECLRALENFREDIARTYFHQLIETINYLHENGIVHRDIKPDNLLLGADFSLKVADFSFATFALTENDTPLQRELFGTTNYMAPELLANGNYIGQCIDIFSCGVILFLMVVGQPPFDKASEQDPRFRLIMKHQFSTFWRQYERGGRSFSNDFKNLINSMLAYEPSERLTIAEIKVQPWYLGKTCSVEELHDEYEKRKQDFLRHQEERAERAQKEKEDKAMLKKKTEVTMANPKLASFHMMKGITPLKYRSISDVLDQEIKNRLNSEDLKAERVSREYIFTGYRGLTEAFYNVSQEMMFKILLLLSNKIFNNTKVSPSEFKIKGRVISDNSDFTGDISIEITQVDDDSCCLNFKRLKGPLVPFYKYIEESVKVDIDKSIKTLVDTTPEN